MNDSSSSYLHYYSTTASCHYNSELRGGASALLSAALALALALALDFGFGVSCLAALPDGPVSSLGMTVSNGSPSSPKNRIKFARGKSDFSSATWPAVYPSCRHAHQQRVPS